MSGAIFFIPSDKPYSIVYYRISLGEGNRLIGKTETKVKDPKDYEVETTLTGKAKSDLVQAKFYNHQELEDFNNWIVKQKSELRKDPDAKEKLHDRIEEKFDRSTAKYGKKKKYTLIQFFDRKIKNLTKKKKSAATINIYNISKQYLIEFGDSVDLKWGVNYRHVTDDFLEDFEEYLLYEAQSKKDKTKIGFSQNYTNLIISCVMSVMNMALKDIQHTNGSYKAFELTEAESFGVYLEEEEVKSLLNLELDNERDKAIRDYFVLLCRTGARVSDAMKWTTNNITTKKDGSPIILYRAEKTDKLHSVYITEEIQMILNRWGVLGRSEKDGFPNESKGINIYKEKINNHVGILCKRAGGTLLDDVTGKINNKEVTKPKFEWVKSHVGKRTASSLAYISGESIDWIRENITRHSNNKTTVNYIKCNDRLEQLLIDKEDYVA